MNRWPDELVVSCTNRRWVADDLASGAHGRSVVTWDQGLDLLDMRGRSWALWTPAEHAARLAHSGLAMTLSAPGGALLAGLEREWTGRNIWHGRWADIADAPAVGFYKRAESKIAPEAGWTERDRLDPACFADDDELHCSDRLIDFTDEWRCFAAGGVALTAAAYRRGHLWWDGEWDDRDSDEALGYAQRVLDARADWPAGFVIDVGRDRGGHWWVVECNPAWCAGMYGCDKSACYEAIVASSDNRHDPGRWAWRPDSSLVRYARSRAKLRPWTTLRPV